MSATKEVLQIMVYAAGKMKNQYSGPSIYDANGPLVYFQYVLTSKK